MGTYRYWTPNSRQQKIDLTTIDQNVKQNLSFGIRTMIRILNNICTSNIIIHY